MLVFASFLVTESLNLKLQCFFTYIFIFLPQIYSLWCLFYINHELGGVMYGVDIQVKSQFRNFITFFDKHFKRITVEQIHSVWLEIKGLIQSIFTA